MGKRKLQQNSKKIQNKAYGKRKFKYALYVLVTLFIVSLAIYAIFTFRIETLDKTPENISIIKGTGSYLANETISIKEGNYFGYNIILSKNETIRIYMENLENGILNTLLLNSAQFKKYNEINGTPSFKLINYFIDGTFFGVRSADFKFVAPETDTYYFLFGRKPLLEEQPNIQGDATVSLLVSKIDYNGDGPTKEAVSSY